MYKVCSLRRPAWWDLIVQVKNKSDDWFSQPIHRSILFSRQPSSRSRNVPDSVILTQPGEGASLGRESRWEGDQGEGVLWFKPREVAWLGLWLGFKC